MFWVIWTETDWIMSDMDLIMGDLEWNHEWFGMESWVIWNRLNLEWSGAVWILSDLEWNRFGGVWMVKWNGLGCCVILFSCCNVLKALKECVYMVCRWVWFFLGINLTYELLDLIFCLFIFSGVHLLEAHVPQDIPDRIHCLLAFEILLSPFPTDDLQHHYMRDGQELQNSISIKRITSNDKCSFKFS